ncbi:MAG: DNA polymerase III subunit alpha [Bacteroidetes bacterium GWF2_38_335]|nr:MAG: DNA polymerase III subunit alpha [Bacteroidetes bacterium GWF2_38_335]OFY81077.1 MAG: DNA polymerase III subunit alpha [Bacteroidetes bacterium RIFOXYA12_FULL_38_20]HBS87604.1 DNA polymerase III subunit alpha [Bacteroidales bacterium]
MYLIFDTETTGLPRNHNAPLSDFDNWPRVVQIAWQLHDDLGNILEHDDYLIKPDGFDIPYDTEQVHGISTALANRDGVDIQTVLTKFNEILEKTEFIAGQNLAFDINILGCEFLRYGIDSKLTSMPVLDTCTEITAELCRLPGGRGGKFKLPTLSELHSHLFGHGFSEAHNATADVEATARCFLELMRNGVFTAKDLQKEDDFLRKFISNNPNPFEPIGIPHRNLKKESAKIAESVKSEEISDSEIDHNLALLKDMPFSHLHNHTQFSILQSTTEISSLVEKTAEFKMPAVSITDNGNMMGAFNFIQEVLNHNKNVVKKNKEEKEKGNEPIGAIIKPIVGCELNVCKNHLDKSTKDNGSHVVFLAKNKKGYHNLAKLSTIANIDGFYYVPRVDKDVITKYKDDLIVLSGGRFGEIPNLILNVGEQQAEESLLWWKEQFGDDFYLEIVDHSLPEEKIMNETLLRFSKKHNIKLVATNNSYYIEQSEADAHDILLCVRDSEKQATPIGKGRGYRFGFPNQEFYFKSQEEMKKIFSSLPEAIINISEVTDKIEIYDLATDVLLPQFDIPEEFKNPEDEKDSGKRGENAYLRHLTFKGAEKRYGTLTPELKERLEFELETIEKTGYPGYFLIVQDFTSQARKMGVSVGPGRGSAAGSAVAYCIGITNVDPIKYDLLFERFLNPDRVSLPDIDIDFDDEGRDSVIKWVVEKYGYHQVAQIITYGTMAAKSSIRDTARVLDLPLANADKLAKLMPDIKLNKLFTMDKASLKEKAKDKYQDALELISIVEKGNSPEAETLSKAKYLEGSLRNTGVHACGVIITPRNITELIPVTKAKDADLLVTQFDNSVVEPAGLLKMDFLGLKTLTLIKHSVRMIKERYGIDIDPDEIPLDDEKTYQLFQKGETIGIFQYESPGMQKHLKELKPTTFADLIAMNALYRPGPMEYIPSFIKRKHGQEEVTYDLADMKENLEETYGITVYQEQVMLLSQRLAGFSKGEADTLRKAMGKKKFDLLEKMKPKFLDQGEQKGHPRDKLEKIWKDWEAFASYAFNKSHSTCYAYIAFQTAYLKANYPSEYMASVLSNNMSDIKQVTFFMDECKRMGLKVLGPDVNESGVSFIVNSDGNIRFGMAAIKGVGEAAVESIIKERNSKGEFTGIFDFVERVDLRAVNKKSIEALAIAGGFDRFSEIKRHQYFAPDDLGTIFIEKLIRYGNKQKEDKSSNQVSLFGTVETARISKPDIPNCPEWRTKERLEKEKELVGIYISAHPLDYFRLEMAQLNLTPLSELSDLKKYFNKDIVVAGMVSEPKKGVTKTNKPFASLVLEDYTGGHKFFLFGNDYVSYSKFLDEELSLVIFGKVQPRLYPKDKDNPELEFRIKKIHLLTEVRDELFNSVNITIDIKNVTREFIDEFHKVALANEGKKKLTVCFNSAEDGIRLKMFSRNYRVNLSENLVGFLAKNPNIEFKFE